MYLSRARNKATLPPEYNKSVLIVFSLQIDIRNQKRHTANTTSIVIRKRMSWQRQRQQHRMNSIMAEENYINSNETDTFRVVYEKLHTATKAAGIASLGAKRWRK